MSHPFTCKSKFETLHHEAEQLRNKRLKLQQSADKAKRKGEEIYESVDKWLIEAGKAIEEADEFIQGEEQAKKRCFVGLCPDLKTRYLLSKKAEKKALAIDKLVNEGDHDPISFRPRILQIVASSVYHREALNSRVLFLKQVMDALRDPNLNKIGVYGMGGVGKTTLAKEVHRQAIEEKLFDEVVMVAVNQTPELRRIQSEVADVLGLTFDVEEYLEELIDYMRVGIPIGDDCKGCKILLTSRDKHVLSQMGTQVVFHLDVLQDEEAWSLFEMTLADAKDSELPPIATEVAKKCAGLPLLLLTVATDLRNRESYAWNDKLKQLSVFDNEEIYAKVHSVLESSYNDLPGNEVKSFFLLCGLLGLSNIPIRSFAQSSLFNRMVSFPNLEDLRLDSVTCEKIWHDQLSATYSNLKSLTVTRCDNLKYLFTTSIVKSLLHLKKLHIGVCRSMKEIILTEESIEEEDERVNKIFFPKLDVLGLRHLPNLIRFCSGYQIEYQSLRDLDLVGCGALMCLVPSVPHADMMAKKVYTETNHNTEIQSLFNEM
ncbi:hypothetical protein GH714_012031 [Hevea brasiliensis]|uniref:NB-ARC domain-containing protein n=1 Tax=Hevea brasiliensis TaxID=3981 RepID=A0A6A6L2Z5_HEVBR|nr:hypothetical protein GH714_012031 [Hevea brasiliensis]